MVISSDKALDYLKSPTHLEVNISLGYETRMNVITLPSAWFSMCKWHRCLGKHVNKTEVARSGIKVNLNVRFGIKANWMSL
jgi:hypothetical protein